MVAVSVVAGGLAVVIDLVAGAGLHQQQHCYIFQMWKQQLYVNSRNTIFDAIIINNNIFNDIIIK